MRGDGGRVEQVFAAWLSSQGWQVRRQVGYMDVVAERNGQRLVAEVKGRTGSPGLDVDTLFGQLLRRMAGGDDSTRYAVVVPAGRSLTAVERVHPDVRRALRLEVYAVTDEDEVTQH